MSNFGMSPSKVYANDSAGGNPAFWSVMQGGLDGTIEGLLHSDTNITDAINAKFASPNDAAARKNVVVLITRATANCIGEKLTGQSLDPESDTVSVLRALDPGTADALVAIINDDSNTDLHNAFAQKSVNDVIHYITRQTGRGLFQAAIEKLTATATDPMSVLNGITGILKGLIP